MFHTNGSGLYCERLVSASLFSEKSSKSHKSTVDFSHRVPNPQSKSVASFIRRVEHLAIKESLYRIYAVENMTPNEC